MNKKLTKILPKHKLDKDIWRYIELHLNEYLMRDKINDLPKYTAGNSIWNQIETDLDNINEKKNKIRKIKIQHVISIAASVLLIFGVMFFIFKQKQNNETISYSTEIISSDNIIEYGYKNQINNIEQYCKNFPNICEEPQYIELIQTLNEQLYKLDEIENLITNSNNSNLILYKNRLMNEISGTEQKILLLFKIVN